MFCATWDVISGMTRTFHMGFLPSVYTPPIPSSPCRFCQLSTTGGHGERCKDSQVSPRQSSGRQHILGGCIWSNSQSTAGSVWGSPSGKQFVDLYMHFYPIYVCFSALWIEADYQRWHKNIIGLINNVAWPLPRFLISITETLYNAVERA